MADKCSSSSETDKFKITSEQEQSSDADDSGEVHTRFSSDIHITTQKRKGDGKFFRLTLTQMTVHI